MRQTGPNIEIVVELAQDATAEQLHVRSPAGRWVHIGEFELVEQRRETRLFTARFSWDDSEFTDRIKTVLTPAARAEPAEATVEPLDLFVEVAAPAHRFTEDPQPEDQLPHLDNHQDNATSPVRGRLALGRFRSTELSGRSKYSSNGIDHLIYPSERGNLTLAVDMMPRPIVKARITKARIEDEELRFRGTLYTHHTEPRDLQFALEGRDTDVVITARLDAQEDKDYPANHWGHRSYRISATVPLAEFLDKGVGDDVFTAWVFTTADDAIETHRARVGLSRYLVRRRANEASVERDERAALVSAYYTFQAKKLSLNVEFFDAPQLRSMLAKIKKSRSRSGRRTEQKPVWLIGEQKYKAQDTGLAFFRFMREHHREIDAYYVIAEDAPDKTNVVELDHVVDFRSSEHMDLFFRAERIITSHHPEYIYPSKSRMLQRSVSTVRVFLQHGVFGVRRLDKLYGRHAADFHTDLFIVSSDREKRNAITDLGYRHDEVAVTGLSRFDTLFDGRTEIKPRQILIMPTWREWLQTEHAFLNSRYFAHWQELLTSARFSQLLAEHDAEAVLVLHPNMRKYSNHLRSTRVRLADQGEGTVQRLLKESAVLITDYSSVGFDFSFLDKPVLYYQFDSARFLKEGSHIDLDSELPGPIVSTQDGLLDCFEQTLDRGATIEAEYAHRVSSLVAHRDTSNGERIFQAVSAARRRRKPLSERYIEIFRSAERVARERSAYLGVMRRVFTVWKRLPMKNDLVVFEANGETQMSDSPKAIYDELVRRGDTRTKVWVYRGNPKVSDEHTRVVKRFSLAYFWYLARAKYWISNEHFPEYLTRRKEGVFLQTWHGTPLKKNLHDQHSATPRDEQLLEEHSRAVTQWTHLLSPSPYATKAFSSAFGHQAEVLEVGYPRNDSLTAQDNRARGVRVRQKLGISTEKKAVLYAPTYRDDKPAGDNRFIFDPPFSITEMADVLGPDRVLLVRLHHRTINKLPIPDEYVGRIINVTNYRGINDLYLASDALITDYSSVVFDYAILHKPIVLLAYDLQKYRDEVRGFYLDYARDLPGPIVTDLDDLAGALAREEKELTDREEFLQTFAPHEDGGAAGRVVDRLFDPT